MRDKGASRAIPPARIASASASALVNSGGRSGPSATRAAPVSVAKSTISSGLSSPALASASPSTSRPSASVLPLPTVRPLRLDRKHVVQGKSVYVSVDPVVCRYIKNIHSHDRTYQRLLTTCVNQHTIS